MKTNAFGDVIVESDAPKTNAFGDAIVEDYSTTAEILKGVGRGAMQGVAAIPKFGGMVADYIRTKAPGLVGPQLDIGGEQSALTTLGQSISDVGENIFAPSPSLPQKSFWKRTVPEVVGQVAPVIATGLGSGLLTKGPLAAVKGAAVTGALGGMQETVDAYERELERQLESGENDPDKLVGKALTYGVISTGIETGFGAGRLVKKLVQRFGAAEVAKSLSKSGVAGNAIVSFLVNTAKDMGINFGQESAQRLTQDLIVTGQPDWEGIKEEGAAGAVVGFLFGAPANIPTRRIGQEAIPQQAIPTQQPPPVIPQQELPVPEEYGALPPETFVPTEPAAEPTTKPIEVAQPPPAESSLIGRPIPVETEPPLPGSPAAIAAQEAKPTPPKPKVKEVIPVEKEVQRQEAVAPQPPAAGEVPAAESVITIEKINPSGLGETGSIYIKSTINGNPVNVRISDHVQTLTPEVKLAKSAAESVGNMHKDGKELHIFTNEKPKNNEEFVSLIKSALNLSGGMGNKKGQIADFIGLFPKPPKEGRKKLGKYIRKRIEDAGINLTPEIESKAYEIWNKNGRPTNPASLSEFYRTKNENNVSKTIEEILSLTKPTASVKPPELMTPEEFRASFESGGEAVGMTFEESLMEAFRNKKPVNRNLFLDVYKNEINLPRGYVREGDRYVFKQEPKQPQPAPVKPQEVQSAESLRASERQPSEPGQAAEKGEADRGGMVEQAPPVKPESVEPGKPPDISKIAGEKETLEHASRVRASESGSLIDADGVEIKPGEQIKLNFAGGPADMPSPWTLVKAENYFSSVNGKLNPRIVVRAANGVERTFDRANEYSPRKPTPPQEAPVTKPKEPWEMTWPEFVQETGGKLGDFDFDSAVALNHRKRIEEAIVQGNDVPVNVIQSRPEIYSKLKEDWMDGKILPESITKHFENRWPETAKELKQKQPEVLKEYGLEGKKVENKELAVSQTGGPNEAIASREERPQLQLTESKLPLANKILKKEFWDLIDDAKREHQKIVSSYSPESEWLKSRKLVLITAIINRLKIGTQSAIKLVDDLIAGKQNLLEDLAAGKDITISRISASAIPNSTMSSLGYEKSKRSWINKQYQPTAAEKVDVAKKIDDALKKLKIQQGGLQAFGVVPLVWNTAVDIVRTSIKAGWSVADAVEKALDYIKANQKAKWDEAAATKALNDAASITEPEPSKAVIKPSRGKWSGAAMVQEVTWKELDEKSKAWREGKTDQQIRDQLFSWNATRNKDIGIDDDDTFVAIMSDHIKDITTRLDNAKTESEKAELQAAFSEMMTLWVMRGNSQGRALNARKKMEQNEPYLFLHNWTQAVKKIWERRIGIDPVKDVQDFVSNATKQAIEKLMRLLGAGTANEDLRSLLTLAAKNGWQIAVNAGKQLANVMPDLANYRKFYTEKGSDEIVNRFFALLGKSDKDKDGKEGHIWTFEGVIRSELVRLLEEALGKAGVKLPPKAKMTPAQRIAMALSQDPLKADKIKLVDQLIQERLDQMTEEGGENSEAMAELIRDEWDKAMGAMGNGIASERSLRQLAFEALKGIKFTWTDIFDNQGKGLGALKQAFIANASRLVRAEMTNKDADMGSFERAVGKVFDSMAESEKNKWEMNQVQKAARRSLSETAKPEMEAESILERFSRTQTDTPDLKPKEKSAIKLAIEGFFSGDISANEFVATLMNSGLGEGLSNRLLNIVQREQAIRDITNYYRERQRIAKMLGNESKVWQVLNKAAKEEGISWQEFFMDDTSKTQAEKRKKLLEKIKALPVFKDLTDAEQRQLEAALSTAFDRAKLQVMQSQLNRILKIPKVRQLDKLKTDLIPEMFRMMNAGMLDTTAFRKWLSQKFGIPEISGNEAARLLELAQIARDKPEGILRSTVYQEAKKLLEESARINFWDFGQELWYANALASGGTLANVGIGSSVQMTVEVMSRMAANLFRKGGLIDAMRMAAFYFHAFPYAFRASQYMMKTGDYSILPDYQQRLGSLFDASGHMSRTEWLEAMKRGMPLTGIKAIDVPIAQAAYVKRAIIALDRLFSYGATDAILYYNLSQRGDMEGIQKMMKLFDKKETQAAMKQAISEMSPDAPKAKLRARMREIIESGINIEAKEIAQYAAQRAAANAVLTGILGKMQQYIQQLPFLARVPLGLTFPTAALNMTLNAMDIVPGVGLAHYASGLIEEKLPNNHFLKKWGMHLSPEDRRALLAKQAFGFTALLGLAGYLLEGDPDDDDKWFEVTGSMNKTTPQQRKELRSLGIEPYHFRIGGKRGLWFNYKQLPFGGVLAMLGEVRDNQRWNRDKWDEQGILNRAVNSYINGLTYIRDISTMAQFFSMIAPSAYDVDEENIDKTNKWLAQTIGRGYGTFLTPSFLKEIDSIMDDKLYLPDKADGWSYWARHIPFVRRNAGVGPALNMFGEPIRLDPPPLRNWINEGKTHGIYDVVGRKMSQNIFIPQAGQTMTIYDPIMRERRQMNSKEFYIYQKTFGQLAKELIERRLDYYEGLDAEKAKKWFASYEWDNIREKARTAAQRGY